MVDYLHHHLLTVQTQKTMEHGPVLKCLLILSVPILRLLSMSYGLTLEPARANSTSKKCWTTKHGNIKNGNLVEFFVLRLIHHLLLGQRIKFTGRGMKVDCPLPRHPRVHLGRQSRFGIKLGSLGLMHFPLQRWKSTRHGLSGDYPIRRYLSHCLV